MALVLLLPLLILAGLIGSASALPAVDICGQTGQTYQASATHYVARSCAVASPAFGSMRDSVVELTDVAVAGTLVVRGAWSNVTLRLAGCRVVHGAGHGIRFENAGSVTGSTIELGNTTVAATSSGQVSALRFDGTALRSSSVGVTRSTLNATCTASSGAQGILFNQSPMADGTTLTVTGTEIHTAGISYARTFEAFDGSEMSGGAVVTFTNVTGVAAATQLTAINFAWYAGSAVRGGSAVRIAGGAFVADCTGAASCSASSLRFDAANISGGSAVEVSHAALAADGAFARTLQLRQSGLLANGSTISVAGVSAIATARASDAVSVLFDDGSGIADGGTLRVAGGSFTARSLAAFAMSFHFIAKSFVAGGSRVDVAGANLTADAETYGRTIEFNDSPCRDRSAVEFTGVTAHASGRTVSAYNFMLRRNGGIGGESALRVTGGAYAATSATDLTIAIYATASPVADGSRLEVAGATFRCTAGEGALFLLFTDASPVRNGSSLSFRSLDVTADATLRDAIGFEFSARSGIMGGSTLHIANSTFNCTSAQRTASLVNFLDQSSIAHDSQVQLSDVNATVAAWTIAAGLRLSASAIDGQASLLALVDVRMNVTAEYEAVGIKTGTQSRVSNGGTLRILRSAVDVHSNQSFAVGIDFDGSSAICSASRVEVAASSFRTTAQTIVITLRFFGDASITNGSRVELTDVDALAFAGRGRLGSRFPPTVQSTPRCLPSSTFG